MEEHPEKDFLRNQCYVRQIIMRQNGGRPDATIMPTVSVGERSLGSIITLINKREPYSKLPEMRHIARHTQDPALRAEKALRLFCEYYYQAPQEFSASPTASFGADSQAAEALIAAGECELLFSAYGSEFRLVCAVERLATTDYYYRCSWWHNYLFNPRLDRETIILAFHPHTAKQQ